MSNQLEELDFDKIHTILLEQSEDKGVFLLLSVLQVLSRRIDRLSVLDDRIIELLGDINPKINYINQCVDMQNNSLYKQLEMSESLNSKIDKLVDVSLRKKISETVLNGEEIYDVFISHASEDKESFVRPLVEKLKILGCKVFYDELSIKWGDSLREKIDEGLHKCKYGIVVLSPNFFAKKWTQVELNALFSRQMNEKKLILPIWHNITRDEVLRNSPMLSDMLALNTAMYSTEEIANKVVDLVQCKNQENNDEIRF